MICFDFFIYSYYGLKKYPKIILILDFTKNNFIFKRLKMRGLKLNKEKMVALFFFKKLWCQF